MPSRPRRPKSAPAAFINIPYARSYQSVYLAFIAGVAAYGFVPTAAVRDPSSRSQLDRIYDLLRNSEYSFHDLSYVSLDSAKPRAPRFNMPFELGMAVGLTKCVNPRHQWFAFDTHQYRLQKALTDLGGIRPWVHDKTPESVLKALKNALSRENHQPSYQDLLEVYADVLVVAKKM